MRKLAVRVRPLLYIFFNLRDVTSPKVMRLTVESSPYVIRFLMDVVRALRKLM